ncbi:Hsp20/alpha crystallin family protein [Patescibacteria group bacterium]|nr:Hsp20/alpha crystallin family protein [Patescibacteria group bacterium]
MALIPFHPNWLWQPDDDFDQFFKEWPKMKTADFIPAINIYEKGNKIVVEAAIADINPEKIDISVENNTLILKGKSEKKSEVEEKNYYRHEVKSGSFYRAMTLPCKVKREEAEASYKQGVLKIEIPKAEKVKAKKLKIKVKKSKKSKK